MCSGKLNELFFNFDIVFDNHNTEFVAGQSVHGQVTLTLLKPLPLHSVWLSVKGGSWARYELPGWYPRVSQVTYIDLTITLWGNENEKTAQVMEKTAGIHEFQFIFDIPKYCPSTTSGFGDLSYGCGGGIGYRCEVSGTI